MVELSARVTQIVKQNPLIGVALLLLVVGVAFKVLWLIVVVVIGAGSIVWLRFDQRRQLTAWLKDEGIGSKPPVRQTSNSSRTELLAERELENVNRDRVSDSHDVDYESLDRFGTAQTDTRADELEEHGARMPVEPPKGDEVRERLERPLSGLRTAGRSRRRIVFYR